MTIKKAQVIQVFLCEQCAAVHIGFWRDGRMFAEAIPSDIAAFAADLKEKMDESTRRQRLTPSSGTH